MQQDTYPGLVVAATKPGGKPATLLAAMGAEILPVEEDEGNVDRYILGKRLAVERRTGSGFLRGIMDKTLFTSAIYLRERFEIPVLIVEGTVDYERTAFSPQAVRGALSSMLLVYGISLVSTADVQETAGLIAMMARQEQIGIPEISLVPKRKAVDRADVQRRIVEMLPGCGVSMARRLLQRFGSLQRIAQASEAELRELHGIGAKKAAEMYGVLHADYESLDTEEELEDAIEASPGLLFSQPVTLLARQHLIATDAPHRGAGRGRDVIDLVFLDSEANELILVELKRGKLVPEHEVQLCRYLNRAEHSPLLKPWLEKGSQVRGVLATATKSDFRPTTPEISVRFVNREDAIGVLKQLRQQANLSASTAQRPSDRNAPLKEAT